MLDPQLRALVEQKNVRLRRIEIDRGPSPVASQFGIRSLPTLWLFEGKKRVETDTRRVLARVAGM